MQDKVLNSISEEVLLLNFNYNDKDMVFKDYLVNEVLPYMDLSKDTVMLKTGIEVSLREFIEQAVLFNCQNRYHGDFISFANDNVVGFNIKERKEQCDYTFTINRDDKTYVFYEEISGPKYIVVIRNDNVILVCRDDKHDIVMEDVRDKKDFLTRIKKLDLDLFVEVYNRYDEFQNYIRSFNQDKMFYNSLMVGVLNKTSFDDEFDKNLLEIDNLIGLVESGDLFKGDVSNKKNDKSLDINVIPLFDTNVCLKMILKKCRAFYSEFVNDINRIMEQNSIAEKAEYVVDEYLAKVINYKFYDYIKSLVEAVDNSNEVVVNNHFIEDELEEILETLKNELKRLFVNPNSNFDTIAAEVYINIINDTIKNELIAYESLVNASIENQLTELDVVVKEKDSVRKVS